MRTFCAERFGADIFKCLLLRNYQTLKSNLRFKDSANQRRNSPNMSDLQQRLRTTTPPAGAATTSPLPITPAPNGPPTGNAPAGTEGAAKAPPNPAPQPKPAQ